ncbi:hypothetical protein FQR65_LT20934 [Abscondita terminalis]|nr:hypothetical protein FQR65_LT20934 [Abscondita terminalis]
MTGWVVRPTINQRIAVGKRGGASAGDDVTITEAPAQDSHIHAGGSGGVPSRLCQKGLLGESDPDPTQGVCRKESSPPPRARQFRSAVAPKAQGQAAGQEDQREFRQHAKWEGCADYPFISRTMMLAGNRKPNSTSKPGRRGRRGEDFWMIGGRGRQPHRPPWDDEGGGIRDPESVAAGPPGRGEGPSERAFFCRPRLFSSGQARSLATPVGRQGSGRGEEAGRTETEGKGCRRRPRGRFAMEPRPGQSPVESPGGEGRPGKKTFTPSESRSINQDFSAHPDEGKAAARPVSRRPVFFAPRWSRGPAKPRRQGMPPPNEMHSAHPAAGISCRCDQNAGPGPRKTGRQEQQEPKIPIPLGHRTGPPAAMARFDDCPSFRECRRGP